MEKNISILLLLTVTISFWNCSKITCEEFNLNHETMSWHFFPDLKPTYTFYDSDSNQIIFTQTHLFQSQKKEFSCHMCACYPYLESKYESSSDNIILENIAVYEALERDIQSTINYNVDKIESMINITNNDLVQYVDNHNNFKKFEIKELDTLTLNKIKFDNLTQFEIINSSKSKIEIFWVQRNNGIVGFKINNKIWAK